MSARRLPSLHAVRAFEAAARHLSMTRAAEELNVTPGAVSRSVAELEQALDVPLFIRRATGLALTAAGESMAKASCDALDRLAEAAYGVRMHRHRRLTLGIWSFFASRLLLPIWQEFRDAYPDIPVDLHTSSIARELLPGQFDAIIAVGDGSPQAGLVVRNLFPISTVPVCSPSFLADGPLDFNTISMLHVRPRPDDWRRWLDYVGLNEVQINGGSTFESMGPMMVAIRAGLGVGIAIEGLLAPDLARGDIVLADTRRRPTNRFFQLQYETALADDTSLTAFADWLCGRFAKPVPRN